MKILIVEDEKLNAERLIRLIKQIRPQAVICGVLESIVDSVQWLNENVLPDLIMMDVKLSDGLSFEIFEKIAVECPVIFTTAYDEYAVQAFKHNSIDYLLKPVEQEELQAAFDKLERFSQHERQQSIEGVLKYLQPKEYRSRFLLPFRDGYKTILVNNVVYFYSEMKITRARLDNGTEEVLAQTMEELEQQLNPKEFFRANRQYIIHIDSIDQVYNYFNSKLKIVLRKNPEVEIIVSREKAPLLKAWMDF